MNIPESILNGIKASNILLSNYSDSAKLGEEIILRPYESIAYYIEK